MDRRRHILVVEDDPAIGPASTELLAVHGYRAMLASTLAQAQRLLRERDDIDLVLLDLQLGDQRGEDLAGSIRAHAQPPALLVFSALPMDELNDAASAMCAAGIVQKPCSAEDLIEAIDQALA